MIRYDIGLEEARSRTLQELKPLAPLNLPVGEVGGLVAAQPCATQVDCPSASVSLKDGYAVRSADVRTASAQNPTRLKLVGRSAAGDATDLTVEVATAVRVTTGARLPRGADAVVADEFAAESDGWALCYRDARAHQNVLAQGCDAGRGEPIVASGEILTPAKTGLLAAGGVPTVCVRPRPRVGLVAIGDELVLAGRPLTPGRLYASNIVTLQSWLGRFQIAAETAVVGDRKGAIRAQVAGMLDRVDVVLTSGGAWKSERDLTVDVLKEMGGQVVFHRVRMGPGKAVAFVRMKDRSVFCLPGGPPSNEMAFLQIVLPGLLHLAGRAPVPFACAAAVLAERVGGDEDWTQFFYATFAGSGGERVVRPLQSRSRLRSQAEASALICVPEGTASLEPGTQIEVQVLHDLPAR